MASERYLKEILNADWIIFNNSLASVSEEDLLRMLHFEKTTKKRVSYLKRLHSRFCALRQKREFEEILKFS